MKKFTTIFIPILLIILIGLMSQIGLVPEVKASADPLRPASCPIENCQQMQADILSSTIRIHLQVWRVKPDESGYDLDESIGHATLRNDRYLVTHNHYGLLEQTDLPGTAISVVIYDSNGQYLFSSPLTDYVLSREGEETLVFEMKNDYDRNQLAMVGVISAEFADWRSLRLQPGMEVAQVDWNGSVSRVDWVTVEEIITEEGVPRLLLSDGITRGSSGGGIFWNGIHVANNWKSLEHLDGADNIIYTNSVAPLNDYR
jgi:hypothetical protein